MATTIVTKYGSDAPAASDIVRGELAVDTENGRLYTENAAGAVVEIGLKPEANVDVTGTITATGTSVFTNLDISGDIDVDGTTNLDATNIVGALDVTGTATVDGLTTSGTIKIDSVTPALWFYENDATNLNGFIRNVAGDLLIQTINDAGSAVNTRMLIDHSTGDINLGYEDTGTTAKLFWDAAAENLTITGQGNQLLLARSSVDTIQFGTGTVSPITGLFIQNATDSNIMMKIDDSAPTDSFVLNSSGNVGIGTASPTGNYTKALHIHGSGSGASLHLTDPTSGATASDGLEVFQYATDGYIWEREAGTLRFGTSAKERMRIAANGDISFYEDTGTTAKMVWSASNESLGINSGGRQSVAGLNSRVNGAAVEFGHTNNGGGYYGTLGSYGANGSSYIGFSTSAELNANTFTTTGILGNIINGDTSGNLRFQQVTNASATGQTPVDRMILDNSGNLLVGGTSLDASGSIGFTSGGRIRQIGAAGVVNQSLIGAISGVSNGLQIDQDASNNQSYIFNIGGTPAVKIDSLGKVGIGTSSPSATLELNSDTANAAKLKVGRSNIHDNCLEFGTDGGNSVINAIGNASVNATLVFNRSTTSATSESMRIDGDGNLLVGKTASSFNAAGAEIRESGVVIGTVDGAAGLIANRLTSDGTLIQLSKDGTTIGSLGTVSGDIYIGQGDTNLVFNEGGNQIIPAGTNGANRDDAVSLGDSGVRFKNLYLSGRAYINDGIKLDSGDGIYFGQDGTAANKLDDYEEGTFTASLVGNTTGGSHTYGYQGGKYTKIGNTVVASFGLYITTKDTNMDGNVLVSGLPFSASMGTNVFANLAVGWSANITYGDMLGGYINSGTSVALRRSTSGAASGFLPSDNVAAGTVYLFGTITYQTA